MGTNQETGILENAKHWVETMESNTCLLFHHFHWLAYFLYIFLLHGSCRHALLPVGQEMCRREMPILRRFGKFNQGLDYVFQEWVEHLKWQDEEVIRICYPTNEVLIKEIREFPFHFMEVLSAFVDIFVTHPIIVVPGMYAEKET